MRRTVAALVLAVLAAGCRDGRHPYPADVVDNFIRACTARGAPEGACRCTLDAVRRRYTAEEYRALESRLGRGEAPPELANLAAECR
jgi:hypothetical protein